MVYNLYKEVLTHNSNKENGNIKRSQANIRKNTKLQFNEILCPKNCNKISSTECKNCEYKKEYYRKHKLGLSLVTMICIWGMKEPMLE